MSAVGTCSYEAMRLYPADLVLLYLQSKLTVGVLRAMNGTSDVTRRLAQNVDVTLLGRAIERVSYDASAGKVRVTCADGSSELYDNVILATQANTACKLLDAEHYQPQLKALRKFR